MQRTPVLSWNLVIWALFWGTQHDWQCDWRINDWSHHGTVNFNLINNIWVHVTSSVLGSITSDQKIIHCLCSVSWLTYCKSLLTVVACALRDITTNTLIFYTFFAMNLSLTIITNTNFLEKITTSNSFLTFRSRFSTCYY